MTVQADHVLLNERVDTQRSWMVIAIETILLATIFAAIVSSPPPNVNEAHYLIKAKHFWDREFCANDLFVTSHETHWLFYASHGWLCRFLEFESVAWIGRIFSWLAVSWGLVLLARVFWSRFGVSILIGALTVVLNLKLNLAGEWFVGGVEAKCYAYGLIFAGMAMWLMGRAKRALIFFGMACGFHIVVGLWASLALALTIVIEMLNGKFNDDQRSPNRTATSRAQLILALAIAAAFFFIGFWPAITQNQNALAETVLAASKLQSLSRLAHHQLASEFDCWILFVPMTLIWLVLANANRPKCRNLRRLNSVAFSSLIFSVFGALLTFAVTSDSQGWIQDFSARLLTLYWFRLADVMVPLATVFNAGVFLQRFPAQASARQWIAIAGFAIPIWAIAINSLDNFSDPRSGSARQVERTFSTEAGQKRAIEAERNWQKTCRWLRDNTPADAVFVTPEFQQTFKWYAWRSEVANWKDMPQDANGVLQWDARRKLLYQGVVTHAMEGQGDWIPENLQPVHFFEAVGPLALGENLAKLAKTWNADFLIVEQRVVDYYETWLELPQLSGAFEQVYPEPEQRKSTFVVYRLR